MSSADPSLDDLLALARAFAAADSETETLAKAGQAALELARGLDQDFGRFARLVTTMPDLGLSTRLLELPLRLAHAGETELGLAVARNFSFLAQEQMRGEEAVILARAGRRSEALSLVASNLETARDIPLAEAKAGDAYRALGEDDAAEVYYRRALAETRDAADRGAAVLRLVSLLSDLGREDDAAALLTAERARPNVPSPVTVAAVGRNEPCPCGSGKKYKRCHGA